MTVIMRSDTNTGSRGRISFVLIGCERSGEYRCRKKDFVRRDIRTRKCGSPFKLRGKPVVGGQGWMMKLMCGIHNHELGKSLVRHPYTERLTKDEKTIIADMIMIKSMEKPRNILLTLKEHNVNRMTFSAGFAYLEGEHVNNVVWDLERFRAQSKKDHADVGSIQPFIHDFIDNIVDVKADGNYGYRSFAGLLGMGEESWSLLHNHLLKELGKFSDDYIKLFGSTDKFEELRM
ncbi:uncharacterized protein LOC114376908 [Glycine soja]|uniref:uncharacterized protein LOC114376908 n=1 Tax=Glycine soja TaxID=3848 RepID=UPI0010393329|nr:uncharacterized protein LOC114376908 [Glycine soja]